MDHSGRTESLLKTSEKAIDLADALAVAAGVLVDEAHSRIEETSQKLAELGNLPGQMARESPRPSRRLDTVLLLLHPE